MGMTFVVAAALAALLATQLAFFEGYVRQKYPTATPATVRMADGAAAGEPFVVDEGWEERATELYGLWMTGEADGRPFAAALLAADPDGTLERVQRTLLAGSPEQRARALELLERAGARDLEPSFGWMRDRAERMGKPSLAQAIDEAIAAAP